LPFSKLLKSSNLLSVISVQTLAPTAFLKLETLARGYFGS